MIFALIQPLLAIDIGEVIVGLVALIFVILRQLFEANKNPAPKVPRGAPVVPPPQPNMPPAPQPAAGQQADPLRAQVEEFLRRAGRPQGQPQPAPAREIEVLVDPSQTSGPRTIGQPLKQAEWRKTTPDQPPTKPATSGNKNRSGRGSGKQRRQSVAEHVAEQVTSHTRNLADQASRLGQRIVAEDQQFDVQLKAKFDHTVGTLAGSVTPDAAEQTPPPPDTPAAQLAAMLANPGGIRQAVLLNEIMRRPSDRW
jgi:hypothetical protein